MVLASSASPSEAQFTPKTQDLSNGTVSSHEVIKDFNQLPEIAASTDNSVSVAELANQSEAKDFELKSLDGGNQPKTTEVVASPAPPIPRNALSKITGYYCQQVPGYRIWDGGGYCGLTKSGIPVESGIAACGEKYPLGTEIEVVGVGRLVCADRGLLEPDQVDIFFKTNKDLEEAQIPSRAHVTMIKK